MQGAHDGLELVETRPSTRAEVVLRNFVPVLLGHAPREAAVLNLLQPVVHWWVTCWVALEDGSRRPRVVDGLEVEGLDLECLHDDGHDERVWKGGVRRGMRNVKRESETMDKRPKGEGVEKHGAA